ncbi:hypothetical protein PHMEG_00039517, partial [Phytophthora megakarya]
MPVGAFVEDERRRLIAMFDICKPLDEITESDWINYFWQIDYGPRLTDVDSRVPKLAHEMYQILVKENMEWMIEGKPKKIVGYLIDALAPEQFRPTVKNEMARESNKPLMKNVVAFI